MKNSEDIEANNGGGIKNLNPLIDAKLAHLVCCDLRASFLGFSAELIMSKGIATL
jgi:hypothetical protein